MRTQMRIFIVKIRKKEAFLSSLKKVMFFHDAASKTRTYNKISNFFEDLSSVNPRSHPKNAKSFESFVNFLGPVYPLGRALNLNREWMYWNFKRL